MSVRNDLVNVEENEYFDQKTRKFALTNAPWIHMCILDFKTTHTAII